MHTGTVLVGEMVVPERDLIRTEYYNDFRLPNDLHYMAGDVVICDQFGGAMIASARPKRLGPFDAEDLHLFRALDPHLRRTLQVQKKLALLDGQREALDRIPIGCVLVGRGARVLLANRAAEEVFSRKDGLMYSNGQLTAAFPSAATRLRRLLRGVASNQPMPEPGGVLAVPRSAKERPYSVLVAPLPRKPLNWGGYSPVAVVFITDPAAQPDDGSVLAQLYHLTPAEARLAQALMNGQGLRHAAEELGISANTAKTQLKHIFGKTQTKRQAELIRVLANGLLARAS
jgi:DNA-binding CsgD family transcriptional regulator